MVIAADQKRSPREVLHSAILALEELGLADEQMPDEPSRLEPPRVAGAREKKRLVQELKARGMSRSEVVRELGYSTATVGRLWRDS